MNPVKKLFRNHQIVHFSSELINHFRHKFNPNLCLDEKFSIKDHYVKSYIKEINVKTQNLSGEQLIRIKLKNYLELTILIITMFAFSLCNYLNFSHGSYILRLRLADFSLIFGGKQQYILYAGILYELMIIITYYLLHFNVSSKKFCWINLLRVLNGDSSPKILSFNSLSDGILLRKLIFRSKLMFSLVKSAHSTIMLMIGVCYLITFFRYIFFAYKLSVWLPFLCSASFYYISIFISCQLFFYWLCYFYLSCYYFHLKMVKLNIKIKLIKNETINIRERTRIKMVKQMVIHHNTICQQFNLYNRFWKTSYANMLFFNIFLNLVMFYQLFENINIFIRIVFLQGVISSWSLIFFMNYLAASLTDQMNKLSKEFSLIQWSIKGSKDKIKVKLDLLSAFERSIHCKIGLRISGFGVMTFQLLSRVNINFISLNININSQNH